MGSCSYLDPVSLLAQSAVSIRLGRRASNCSHTLLATTRRAPLNDSSVQGSIKQPSTAASAPTQVLQSVGIEHLGRHTVESEYSGVERLLPPRHGGPRQRSSALPGRDGALHVAVNGAAERVVDELAPHLHSHSAEQPPPAFLGARDGESEVRAVRSQQHGPRWTPPLDAPAAASPRESTAQVGGDAAESEYEYGGPRYDQNPQFGSLARRAKSPAAAHQQQHLEAGAAGLGHRTIPQNGHAASRQKRQQPAQPPLRPRLLAVDRGHDGKALLPVATAAASAVAKAAATVANADADLEEVDSASTWTNHDYSCTLPLAAAVPLVGSLRSSLSSSAAAAAAAPQHSIAAVAAVTTAADRQPPAPGEPEPAPLAGLPPQPPGEPPAWPGDGPIGGRWGGLESELLACRSCHSVQRFLQLMGPRVHSELLGNAIVHLSHLVSEEAPDGDVERQLLAGLMDDLTQRLRGSMRQLRCGLLAAVICAMSRLRCYDGPLLREAAAAAREAAAEELTTRQTAGLVWAFGRYHRDFAFRLEAGWTAALLQAVLPRLPQASPQDVAMVLYGCALQRDPPPPPALDALLAASLRGMPMAAGPELSMSMWALATLRLHPGREWLRAFLDRCDAATRTFGSGAAVSNVLYGLATMRVQPPAPWMLNFLWQAQRRMNTMDAQSLVMLGWALGRMRYRPDKKWLTRFFRYSRSAVLLQPRDPHIMGTSAQELARQPPGQAALQAASQRQVELWRRQQQRLQQRLQQRRPGPWGDGGGGPPAAAAVAPRRRAIDAAEALALPPQAYNVLLWACVRLSCRPMGRWLPLLCAAVQPRLAAWPPHELSALLWGLSRLSCRPRDDWMTEFCAAARGSMARFQPPDCVMTLLALSRLCSGLGYRVSDADLANLLAQRLAPYYSRLQTTTLISVLLAVSRVTPRVRPARLEEALTALLERVQAIGVSTEGTAGADAAAAAERPDDRAPPPAAAPSPQHYLRQDHQQDEQSSGPPPPAAEASAADAAAAAVTALPPMTARECANAVFAVGCVALWPGYNDTLRGLCGQLLRELLPRAFRMAPAFNGVDLVLLVHGVAMSRSRVGPQWLRRHEEQAMRVLRAGELQSGQLRELHRAYHALDYAPELLPGPGPGTPEGGGFAAGRERVGSAGPAGSSRSSGAGASTSTSVGPFGRGLERAGVVEESAERGALDVSWVPGEGSSMGEGEGEGQEERPVELSEAARARRRRAAQGRRRRVTAAVERRVADIRLQAGVGGKKGEQGPVTSQRQLAAAPLPRQGIVDEAEGGAGAAAVVGGDELQAAERALRLRRATIRRFTLVARRGETRGTLSPPAPRQASAGATALPADGAGGR